MKKSIFLTTVNETKHRLDMKYYCHQCPDGGVLFTTGISVAEAGARLMLSRRHTDKIIVIGPPSCAFEEETGKTIPAVSFTNITPDVEDMSEYGFFCYRIHEFIDQTDVEYLDIIEALTKEEHAKVLESISAFCGKYAGGPEAVDSLFLRLGTDPEFARLFDREVCDALDPDEIRWAKHYLYSRMDDSLEMQILEENRNVSVCFLPVETDGVISVEALAGIIREIIRDNDDDIELFVDAQGMSVTDGSTLISTLLLLNRRIGYQCSLTGLIESENAPDHFLRRVLDVKKNYNITMLITGIEQFLDYGRDTQLKEYWETLGAEDPDAEALFAGMDLVDEGISLCQTELISAGITAIRDVSRDVRGSDDGHSFYFRMILSAIWADYGILLEGDELSIPELIRWSIRKGFYQQALTIIESRIPEDMVRRGIYYYAEDEEDLQRFLAAVNEIYWLRESWKTRYLYSDPDHYFIRYYRKGYKGGGNTSEKAAEALAAFRVGQIGDTSGNCLPAFSALGDDTLLREILSGYYLICRLRNRVNHAMTKGDGLKPGPERPDSRKALRKTLQEFTDRYTRACGMVNPTLEIPRISSETFAAYIKKHRLKPSGR